MTNKIDLNASPIKQFVHTTINQISNGLPEGFYIKDDIEFELSVVSVGDKQGGIDLKVLNLGGGSKKEETQKIRFSVTNKKTETDPITEAKRKILKDEGLL
jgi:hypothetical protein